MADCPNCGAVHGGRAYDLCPWCLFKPREEGGCGHWTSEPAEVAGWYVVDAEGMRRGLAMIGAGRSFVEPLGYRWSVPLPEMPPVPSNKENSHE
jgi:hypothetical protein